MTNDQGAEATQLSLAPGFSPVIGVAAMETVSTVLCADEEAVETARHSSRDSTPG
jgi:hypothetical protein